MRRTVRLGTWSLDDQVGNEDLTVITPNADAAATLGAEPFSLENLAARILGKDRIVHRSLSLRIMREAMGAEAGAAARALLPTVRALFRAGADLSEISPTSDRARRVIEAAAAYREKLQGLGLVDPAGALREAASLSSERRTLFVWGYPRLGADELELVDAVAGDGSEVCLPCGPDPVFAENQETARDLARRGWAIVDDGGPENVWERGVELAALEYPHMEAEVRGVLANIKKLLEGGEARAENVALVARDDAFYGPLVLAVAKEYGVPVRALYRVPLTQTRVGDWVLRLLETVGKGFPFEATAGLLRHPLGPDIEEQAWNKALELKPSRDEEWVRCGVDLKKLLPPWPPGDTTRADFALRLKNLLAALPGGARARERDRQAIHALAEAGRLLAGGSAGPEDEVISSGGFREELREIIGETFIAAHPSAEGVALRTPLMMYGARFRFVFALGLVEGAFPAVAADDPVLDFHDRARLRDAGVVLESAPERARRERLSFWALLKAPEKRLSLSFARIAGNRENLPSPYFELLNVEPTRPRTRPAASLQEARRGYLLSASPPSEVAADRVLARAAHAFRVELGREGTGPFDGYDGVVEETLGPEGRQFSASQLSDLARCGFKWWSRNVLKLRKPGEFGESPLFFGSLYHRVLELAARRAMGTGRRLNEHLEKAFVQAEKELEVDRLSAWGSRRAEHLDMLRAAVGSAGFAVGGSKVIAAEEDFGKDSGVEWRGFRLRGVVDRVDRVAASEEGDEGLVLVDYKSGRYVPKPDLQLTIYREAAAAELWPGERVRDSFYYSLRGAERLESSELTEEKLAALVEELKDNLSRGHLPPDAFERDSEQEVCRFCSFDPVCRKGPRLARKHGAQARKQGAEREHREEGDARDE